MKKISNLSVHRKRFIGLTVAIFVIPFVLHFVRIAYNLDLTLGTYVIPVYVSYFALIITASMIFMGLIYLKK